VPTVFFAWELGAGLGHVMQLAPLANALAARGHCVFAALRDLKSAGALFDPAVRLLPAPHLDRTLGPPTPTRSFADILADLTFGDDRVLANHTEAWRNLYRLTRPDLLVFDHSPTALLASRGAPARRVVFGNGFISPPDVWPFPPLRPVPPERLAATERELLGRANALLRAWKQRPLDRLGRLYSQVDATLLTTFPEFDPYAHARPPGARYLGPVNAATGALPRWPDGPGKKVYAYLGAFPALPAVLRFLAARPAPTVAFVPGLDPRLRRALAGSPHLRLEDRPLDLSRTARECDAAVLNGNLGTAAAVLLAGRPALHFPLYFEHELNARSVERVGAGLVASGRKPDVAVAKLNELLESPALVDGARAVAARHADFDPTRQHGQMLDALLALLAAPGAPATPPSPPASPADVRAD
jgi:hypothetical protein